METKLEFENLKESNEMIVNDLEIPSIFRDLAKFKLLLLIKEDSVKAEQLLKDLIQPNNPFRLLALEQKVILHLKDNEFEEAQNTANIIKEEPSASQGLQSRVSQLEKVIKFGGS